MKNEHAIVNETAILKKIEELEKSKIGLSPNLDASEYYNIEAKINLLKEILSQSTALIPVIKATFDEARLFTKPDYKPKFESAEDYISNLKLDI